MWESKCKILVRLIRFYHHDLVYELVRAQPLVYDDVIDLRLGFFSCLYTIGLAPIAVGQLMYTLYPCFDS